MARAKKEVAREAPQTLDIVLTRDLQVGDTERKAGEKIASVTLEPDVSLAYLVRAVEDSLARAVE